MKFFFFNDTATTEIYTLSLHDALPISRAGHLLIPLGRECVVPAAPEYHGGIRPRPAIPHQLCPERSAVRVGRQPVRDHGLFGARPRGVELERVRSDRRGARGARHRLSLLSPAPHVHGGPPCRVLRSSDP